MGMTSRIAPLNALTGEWATDCPLWAQHEAEKAISYAERAKNNEFKDYKGRVMRKAYQRIQQAARRLK